MSELRPPVWQRATDGPLFRLMMIGFLILLLQIPVSQISDTVRARSQTRDQAVTEVIGKWGLPQNLVGPVVSVPYTKRWTVTRDGKLIENHATDWAAFLPDSLRISGSLKGRTLSRGIFDVPVYGSTLELSGRFDKPDFSEWGVDPKDIHWDQAALVMQISDARAIRNQPGLVWNGESRAFKPGGIAVAGAAMASIEAPLKGLIDGDSFEFKIPLMLNGSQHLQFAPMAKESVVALSGDWPHPSFQGRWLPRERSVSDQGFSAEWQVPYLGRNFPQGWRDNTELFANAIESAFFGVSLLSPVDAYRMSERSIKYDILFFGLTFLALWLFELISVRRIHPVQYLLLGAAMGLFYLLELSLAEHIGFVLAFASASVAVIVLFGAYCIAVLGSWLRAGVATLLIAALYLYLYILLRAQDYALLVGSLGALFALAGTMYITRRIDWFAMQQRMTAQSRQGVEQDL